VGLISVVGVVGRINVPLQCGSALSLEFGIGANELAELQAQLTRVSREVTGTTYVAPKNRKTPSRHRLGKAEMPRFDAMPINPMESSRLINNGNGALRVNHLKTTRQSDERSVLLTWF
jgi:hypothetical protein